MQSFFPLCPFFLLGSPSTLPFFHSSYHCSFSIFPFFSFISWSYIYFLIFFFCLLFPNPPPLYSYFLHHLLLPSPHVSFFYIFAIFSTALLLPIPPSLPPSSHLLLSQLCVCVCLQLICLQFICLQFYLFTVHSQPLSLQSLDWQNVQHAECGSCEETQDNTRYLSGGKSERSRILGSKDARSPDRDSR